VVLINNSVITNFLISTKPEFRNVLVNEIDTARVVSLIKFEDFFRNRSKDFSSIAIVSGSLAEPELRLIGKYRDVSILSFEDNPLLFDLNRDWSKTAWSQFHNAFDLVLCEQVLEHVLHPDMAVKNLFQILKPGGLLHITAPAVNNSHGEPFYFYSGFSAATLRGFAEESGLTVFESGSWSSNKVSRMYATCDWAPISQSGSLVHMVLGLWLQRRSITSFFSTLLGKFRIFLTLPFQGAFTPSRQNNFVITWMFAGKETVN